MRIAILGAGITGLSIGYRLAKKAPDVEFTIFERADRVGGLLCSETVGGFTYDRAGGHIMYTKDEEVKAHLWSLLDTKGGVVESRRQTRIFYKGHYVNYPFENGLGDLPKDDNYHCLRGYIEAHVNRMTGEAPAPTNLREWILWRFGTGIAESFMFPYNEKIWKSDLTDMSFSWVSGRVPDAPPDDVLRSAIGIRTEGYKHQLMFGYPLRGGFQALADATAEPIRDRIRLETTVERVEKVGNGWEVNGEPFDRIVSTVPLQHVPRIYTGLDAEIADRIGRLQHLNILCFLIGMEYPTRFPYSWIYLPHKENGPVNRLTHLSNYSPENAPPGCSSVMCEVTFRGDEAPDADETLDDILDSLHAADIIDKSRVIQTDCVRENHAYQFFDLDYDENITAVRDHLDRDGFDTCGRTGRYEYFNSDHCVTAAFAWVDRVLAESTAVGK